MTKARKLYRKLSPEARAFDWGWNAGYKAGSQAGKFRRNKPTKKEQ